MKKITALLLTLILTLSALTANAALPEYLTREYNNYSADYSFSLSFDSSEELVSLLKEINIPEEVEYFVDLKALLETLLSQGMTMKLEANIDNNFRKAELALTADAQSAVTVNQNLSIAADTKMGMWMKMDLDAQTPVLEVIYSYPFLNKYMVIDVFELMDSIDQQEQVLTALNTVFNKEFLNSFRNFSAELMEKYAEIKIGGTYCTVKFSNEAIINMVADAMQYTADMMSGLVPQSEDTSVFGDIYEELPPINDIQILGENGLTYKYSLSAGKLSGAEMTADISIDISKLASELFGTEWTYESKGILDFTAKSNMKLNNVGSTRVSFPTLNADNSFTLADLINTSTPEEYIPAEPEYPYYFVSVYTEELPIKNEEIYVPLRQTLEDAYEDSVTLEYKNGVVTAVCEYFPDFKKLKLTENSAVAYTDSSKINTPTVFIKDGVTWVGTSLFEDVFGWEMYEVTHDILADEYYVSFTTESY